MIRLTFKAAIALLIFLSGGAWAQQYRYGAEVTLYGTIVSAPGETPDGKRNAYPALELVVPVTVNPEPGDEEFSPTAKGVMLLQMVLDQRGMAEFKRLKGKRASVSGTLFHSDNGNHQTDVLIDVSLISESR